MNVIITPTKLKGHVTPPASKSQAHRLLIAAALAEGESVITNITPNDDLLATVSCLKELGAEFAWEGNTLTVKGMGAGEMSPMRRLAHPHMDCGESGSTLRFLIPVALAVRGGGVFTGHGRLMQRPLQPYFDLFDEKGIHYSLDGDTLTVQGMLEPGEYRLPGNISSQFFTGLMLALPLLGGDSKITLTSPLESGAYVELTRDALRDAGVSIVGGSIPGRQRYQPIHQEVEADWSQAAFFYAAHGMGNDLRIKGLNPLSNQADTNIVPLYTELCGNDEEANISVSQYPDLFPALCAMAAVRVGEPVNIGGGLRLRMKESDRISAVAGALKAFGVRFEEFDDGLSIEGRRTLRGNVTIDCCGDHRIAMMAAIAATCADGPVKLLGAQCVSKSYPDFWEVYESLGGQIVRED
ncbi:MAG: 3-phosphoshikimate 1-carboxyvinyltransferase [Oscillospiraceae bacterium]|nr:3-phosphoshikimate 1-carboxyvinyltransferase [Oscillospiraceae bacterium]